MSVTAMARLYNALHSIYTAHDFPGGRRAMRGPDERSDFLFSYLSPEQRVPAEHPLRPIRRIVDAALAPSRRTSRC